MTYKWKLNILSNDAKRMFAVVEEDFIPYPGMALRGYIGDEEVKVNAVVFDRSIKTFRVGLSWMGIEVPDSTAMVQMGWQKLVAQPPQQPQA